MAMTIAESEIDKAVRKRCDEDAAGEEILEVIQRGDKEKLGRPGQNFHLGFECG